MHYLIKVNKNHFHEYYIELFYINAIYIIGIYVFTKKKKITNYISNFEWKSWVYVGRYLSSLNVQIISVISYNIKIYPDLIFSPILTI